jgi:hypothetical protein
VTAYPLRTTSLHPHERAARRFPLVPRGKPRCPPLEVRLSQIRARAQTANTGDQPILHAAQAHNLAALTASDCGLPNLARQLCNRQAELFLSARPLDAATAKMALQPLINLGRLLARDGCGLDAYHLYEQLFTAAKARSGTTINDLIVPFQDLIADADDHRQITQWLWTILLADGSRALVQAGHWPQALQHIHHHNALGLRLLDGRQITVLAHSAAGQHHRAYTVLAGSRPEAPWERIVTTALTAFLHLRRGQTPDTALAELVDLYPAHGDEPDREHHVFDAQLGLCILDLASGSHPGQLIANALVSQALRTQDAYLAREILGHPASTTLLTAETQQNLYSTINAAALGKGTLPADLHTDLMDSVQLSEAALRNALGRQKPGQPPDGRQHLDC